MGKQALNDINRFRGTKPEKDGGKRGLNSVKYDSREGLERKLMGMVAMIIFHSHTGYPAKSPTQGIGSLLAAACLVSLCTIFTLPARCQNLNDRNFMEMRVENGDTVFVDVLPPARVWERLPRQKGRDWRKYYRMVYNFSKVYPFALEARDILRETDSTFSTGKLSRAKKDRYINTIQNDLAKRYEPVLRKMTISQGKVLIKMIARETGLSPYEIIHDYKNSVAAGFWQGVAKLFDGDLRTHYDPLYNDEDAQMEDLVMKWESGDFPAFYWSLFGKDPDIPKLPERKSKKK